MAEKMSLNQKIEKLDAEVEWFYSDDFKLEEAVNRYKQATKLAKEIEKDLNELKNEIEVLAEDFSKQLLIYDIMGLWIITIRCHQ